MFTSSNFTAFFTTINHVIPIFFPFFSPFKRKITNGANFLWQEFFFQFLLGLWYPFRSFVLGNE